MPLDTAIDLLTSRQHAIVAFAAIWLVTCIGMALAPLTAARRTCERFAGLVMDRWKRGAAGKASAAALAALYVTVAGSVVFGPSALAYAALKPEAALSHDDVCSEAVLAISREGASPEQIEHIAHFCDEKQILSALAEKTRN